MIPAWNGLQTMGAIGAGRPIEFGLVAISLLATGTMVVFIFALYQNPGYLRIPKHLRQLALGAAIILTMIVTWGLSQWIGSLVAYLSALKAVNWGPGGATAWTVARDPRTIFQVSTLLSEISDFGFILLLVSFFRQDQDDVDTSVASSSMLRTVTKTTLIIWGLWLGFNLIRGMLTPYIYLQMRNFAAQARQAPPPAIDLVAGMLTAILLAACFFIAPYIVHKSLALAPKEDTGVVPLHEESPEPN